VRRTVVAVRIVLEVTLVIVLGVVPLSCLDDLCGDGLVLWAVVLVLHFLCDTLGNLELFWGAVEYGGTVFCEVKIVRKFMVSERNRSGSTDVCRRRDLGGSPR
jgi:hypothetical protein